MRTKIYSNEMCAAAFKRAGALALGVAVLAIGGYAQGPAAASLFGVYTQAGGGSQGCGASWTYDTNTGGSGGVSNMGGNPSISNCSGGSGGPHATGLVTAAVQSTQQATFCGATASSSDNAAADLTMGTVHNYATTSGFCAYGPATETDLWDFLTFNVPGATSSTITPITLTLSVAGNYADPSGFSSAEVSFQVEPFQVCQCTNGNDVLFAINTAFWPGAGNFGATTDSSSFVTWARPTSSLNGVTLTGVVNLVGASPTLSFALQVKNAASFPNAPGSTPETSTLNYTSSPLYLTLPPGVTYTSASGTFLSGTQSSVAPFSAVHAKLSATTGSTGSFNLNSNFTLAAPPPAFNPVTQPTVLQVGPYTVAIPPRYFHLLTSGPKAGSWYYQGAINGVSLKLLITPLGSNTYQFTASGSPVDFTMLTNPAPVSITVGGNGGNTLQVGF